MSADAPSPKPTAPFLTLPKLVALLALTIVATGAVVYFALRSDGGANENVVSVMDERAASTAKVNTGEVLDATAPNEFAPELGQRYRVRIDSESRDGASMIARIGRTVTFVNNVKPGDVVVIEITRVSRTTAEGTVLERISSGPAIAVAPVSESVQASVSSAASEVYTGTVVSIGKFGDGLIKRGSQQVYISGVEKGDRVVYEVTEKRDNFWNARLVRKLAADESRKSKSDSSAMRAPHIQPGQEYDVTVKEKERSNPDKDGVARIDGLAVLIPGCQPGDHLKIRITERRATLAKAEIVERLPAVAAP